MTTQVISAHDNPDENASDNQVDIPDYNQDDNPNDYTR
jgi:hypothetical protein